MGETFTADVPRLVPTGWLWLLPFFPLAGALVNGLAGKRLQDRLGARAVSAVAIAAMLGASAVAVAAFATLLGQPPEQRYLLDLVWPMLRAGAVQVDLALAIDPLSAVMALVITLVGTLIHVYATGYMAGEPSYWRFFAYLNLFVSAMLLLVLGDGFVTLFVGWEGVGLASFLLIGFWYRERKNASAGLKAFVVNRVGDLGLLAGVLLLFWGLGGTWSPQRGRYEAAVTDGVAPRYEVTTRGGHRASVAGGPTLTFRELERQLALTAADGSRPVEDLLVRQTVWGVPLVFLVCLCLFLGAAGKSAQLPLYVWLPDAMAGPTPVSALIHAATMVTAGVYLIARLNFLFVLSPDAMTVVATVGALTALWAAVLGLFQYDLKRVLAYSTVSQLGFMFVGVGVGATWTGVFHLVTHACFKACLFLGAGSVIHAMHGALHHRARSTAPVGTSDPRLVPDPRDPQDLRNLGGLARRLPRTRWTYLIACWAIAGFPWAAGFFSKDEILWRAWGNGSTRVSGTTLLALGLVAATLTAFYVFRSYYLTFWFRPESEAHVHEPPARMTAVLALLAAGSILTGPLLRLTLEAWLEPVTRLAALSLEEERAFQGGHAAERALMAASVLVAALGWWCARALYRDGARSAARLGAWKARFSRAHALAWEAFRVDALYERLFVRPFRVASRTLAWLDRHALDGVVEGVGALSRGAAWLSGAIDRVFVDGMVNGLAGLVLAGGRRARSVQTGRVNGYVLGAVLGVIVLVLISSLGQGEP